MSNIHNGRNYAYLVQGIDVKSLYLLLNFTENQIRKILSQNICNLKRNYLFKLLPKDKFQYCGTLKIKTKEEGDKSHISSDAYRYPANIFRLIYAVTLLDDTDKPTTQRTKLSEAYRPYGNGLSSSLNFSLFC